MLTSSEPHATILGSAAALPEKGTKPQSLVLLCGAPSEAQVLKQKGAVPLPTPHSSQDIPGGLRMAEGTYGRPTLLSNSSRGAGGIPPLASQITPEICAGTCIPLCPGTGAAGAKFIHP